MDGTVRNGKVLENRDPGVVNGPLCLSACGLCCMLGCGVPGSWLWLCVIAWSTCHSGMVPGLPCCVPVGGFKPDWGQGHGGRSHCGEARSCRPLQSRVAGTAGWKLSSVLRGGATGFTSNKSVLGCERFVLERFRTTRFCGNALT